MMIDEFSDIVLENALSSFQKESSSFGNDLQLIAKMVEENDRPALMRFDKDYQYSPGKEDIKMMSSFLRKMKEEGQQAINCFLHHPQTTFQSELLNILSIISEALLSVPSVSKEMKQKEEEARLDLKKSDFKSGYQEKKEENNDDQSEIDDLEIQIQESDIQLEDICRSQISSISFQEEPSGSASFFAIPQHSLSHYFRIVHALKEEENCTIALILLLDIKKLDPCCKEAILYLSRIYAKLKLYKLAILEYQCLDSESMEGEVLYEMAVCFKTLKLFERAFECFNLAISNGTTDKKSNLYSMCLCELGLLSLQEFKFYQAIYYFRIELSLRPSNLKSHYYLIFCFWKTGQYEKALGLIRLNEKAYTTICLKANPALAGVFTWLVGSIMRQNREKYNISLSVILKYFEHAMMLFNKWRFTNLKIEERDEYHMISTFAVPKEIFLERGMAYLDFGFTEKAMDQFKACHQMYPHHVKALLMMSKIYLERREVNPLTECLLKMYNLLKGAVIWEYDPQMVSLITKIKHEQIYENLQSQKKKLIGSAKIQNYSYSCDIISNLENMHHLMMGGLSIQYHSLIESGHFLLKIKQVHLALLSFNDAAGIDDGDESLMMGLGKCYKQLNEGKESTPYFFKVLKLYPLNVQALEELSDLMDYVSDSKKYGLYQRFIKENIKPAKHIEYLRELSMIQFSEGNYFEGRKNFFLSLSSYPLSKAFLQMIKRLYRRREIREDDQMLLALERISKEGSEVIDQVTLLRMYIDLSLHSKVKKFFSNGPINPQQQKQLCIIFFQYALNCLDSTFIVQFPKIAKIAEKYYQESEAICMGLGYVEEKLRNYERARHYYAAALKNFGRTDAAKLINSCLEKDETEESEQYLMIQMKDLEDSIIESSSISEDSISVNVSFINQSSSSDFTEDMTEPTSKNARIRRLCALYKKFHSQDEKYQNILERAASILPVKVEYLEQLINLKFKLKKYVSALFYIKTYLNCEPSKIEPYDLLIKLYKLQHGDDEQMGQTDMLRQIEQLYLNEIFLKDPVLKVFFYYQYQQYEDSFGSFRELLNNIPKNIFFKLVGNLTKAKAKFKDNDLLIIMRGIAQETLNKNKRLAKDALKEVKTRQESTYFLWFLRFYKQIRTFSQQNQLIILHYIFHYMKLDSLQEFEMICDQASSITDNVFEKQIISSVLKKFIIPPPHSK